MQLLAHTRLQDLPHAVCAENNGCSWKRTAASVRTASKSTKLSTGTVSITYANEFRESATSAHEMLHETSWEQLDAHSFVTPLRPSNSKIDNYRNWRTIKLFLQTPKRRLRAQEIKKLFASCDHADITWHHALTCMKDSWYAQDCLPCPHLDRWRN